MRFGRAGGSGHNIMHFGKRVGQGESVTADSMSLSDSDQYEPIEQLYEQRLLNNQRKRSSKTRYFIPHAFIASLYTNPRQFLKKAGENRDNVFMHFGK